MNLSQSANAPYPQPSSPANRPRECEPDDRRREAIHRPGRHCERSEAIHRAAQRKNGLLRFARNDVELQTRFRDLAARCARGFAVSSAQRGRGERRMPVAPAASCALGSDRTHTSNNEYPGITRRSRTQWFYGLFRALVSAKSARMCERAVPTSRPSLNLSPFVLEGQEPVGERGTDPVSSSTRTVAWA